MNSLTKILLVALIQIAAYASCLAGEVIIGPVYIDRVAVLALPFGGHLAGNLELQLKTAFPPVTEVSCDRTYITTLKSVDLDKRMFALASLAQTTKQPVYMVITDDPTYTAFGGRCSLKVINIAS